MKNFSEEKIKAKVLIERVLKVGFSNISKLTIQRTLDILDGSINITETYRGLSKQYHIGPYKGKSPLGVFVTALDGEPWLMYNLTCLKEGS